MKSHELYPYQKTGIDWIKSKSKCILADDCGLGKSAQSLLARHHESVNIITTASTKLNWANEVLAWTNLKPIVCKGLYSFVWANPGEAVICNYELIPDFCFEPQSPITIIIDEAHFYRNNRPQKYLNMKYVLRRAGIDSQVIAMTGTPICNRINDIFNIIDLIGLTDHFGGKKGFTDILNTKIGKRGDIRNPTITKEFTDKLSQIMLRRMKKDVMEDMPKKVYSVHRIDTWTGSLNAVMNSGLSSLEAFEAMNGPIANGTLPPLAELSRARHDMSVEKIPHTQSLVDSILECGKQVLVYSAHKKPVRHFGLQDKWGIIEGSISTTKRQKSADGLKENKLIGLAATIGAGSCGINLQSANETIINDLHYNLALNLQMEDRTCRIGQTSESVHYRFVCFDHPLDNRLGALLSGKQKLFNSVCEPITVRN